MWQSKRKGSKILLITFAVFTAGAVYIISRIKAGLDSSIRIKKLKEKFYYMEYSGDYGFDRFLKQGGASSDRETALFVGKDLFKGLTVPKFRTGKFGCSTLTARNAGGGVVYGRNFDWMKSTSMVIKSKPVAGYVSLSTVNLDFLDLGVEFNPVRLISKVRSTASLYAPMDGINEKGLCVAVLMIADSDITEQDTGRPDITTTTAVRLLLDKAADVAEAIDLLEKYDMHGSAGMMLHLALTDRTGRSVAVEYVNNKMSVIETPSVTNFYLTPGSKFGVGTEQAHIRYDILMNRLAEHPAMDMEDKKEAMASVTINQYNEFASTEWTVIYNQDTGEIRYYHEENYDEYFAFSIP